MAKLIQQIHNLINIATDKGVTDYHSTAQIDDAIDQGQMMLYRQLVKDYVKNKRVRNDLLPFEKSTDISLAAGVGDLPSDFEHEIELLYLDTEILYPISVKESAFFSKLVIDVVGPPALPRGAIAKIYGNAGTKKILVAPVFAQLTLHYWILPPKPFYAIVTSGGGQLYDDVNSVDVSWSRGMQDFVMENTFKLLGLNLREGQLVNAGLKPIPKEATI